MPYRVVDSPYFRDVLNALDPRYQPPSRKQFSEVIIPKLYNSVKLEVKESLKGAEQVALTSDGWTSRATQSYVTVTSSYVNENWELVSNTLQTRPLDESHTAEAFSKVLKDCVVEWGIPTSLGFPPVVTDNAANVTKAVQLIESAVHVPCLAHTINLAVQKSLKVKRVSHLLARVRRIVAFFHRSALANKLLQSKADLLNLPNHKLIIDVATRWNSAYDMIARFTEMQCAVYSTLTSKEISSVKEKDLNTLSDEDISLAEDLIVCLKPMKDITTMLCTESEPTISVVKPIISQLVAMLVNNQDNGTISEMKNIMKTDIESRYEKQSDVLNMATALDPRFKTLPYLSDQKRHEVYSALATEAAKFTQINVPKIKTEPGSESGPQSVATSLPALPSLPIVPALEEPSTSDVTPLSGNDSLPSSAKVLKMEESFQPSVLQDILGDVYVPKYEPAKAPIEQAEIQLTAYKQEPTVNLTQNPLAWWKTHQNSYPLLARMAKSLLCIPATSVPSERVFSTAGDIVTQQRSNIKSKHVFLSF